MPYTVRSDNDLTFRDKNALSAVLQKTDRIISDAPVTVNFFDDEYGNYQSQTPPSYVIGNAVSISADVVERYRAESKDDTEFMASVLGLNYHELAHVLFTPQRHTQIATQAATANLHGSFNALEDQRIENMFCAEYSNAHQHFTFTVLTHVVDKSNPGNAFPLVYGRKYLPKQVRASVENSFSGTDQIKEALKAVIDEYIDIPYPDADAAYSMKLIGRYADLLKQWQVEEQLSSDAGKSECEVRDEVGNANWDQRKEARDEEDQIAERSKQAQEKRAETESDSNDVEEESSDESGSQAGEEEEPENGEESSGSGANGETEEESDSEESALGSGDGDSEGEEFSEEGSGGVPDDASGEDDLDADREVGESPIAGDIPDTKAPQKSTQEVLREAIEEVVNDSEYSREIENTSQSYYKHRKQLGSSTRMTGDRYRPISPEMRSERNRAKKEIGRILDSVAPGWQYGSHAGVLNLPRYIQSEHGDEDIWDSWDEGREEDIGCEVFISVDCSASMDSFGKKESACAALWVMKSAFDELGVDTLVTSFGDPKNERVIYGRGERVKANEFLVAEAEYGCTIPNTMVETARDVMADSKRKTKLFVSITDGQWSGTFRTYKGEPWQTHMREMSDVTKLLISVEIDPEQATVQEFDHVYRTDASNLASLGATVRDMVMGAMRGKVR